jgi:hypothetical protein
MKSKTKAACMKTLSALLFATLTSCTAGTDKVKSFIAGTYIRHYVDEYTDSYDTLHIVPITNGGSEGFAITKSMRYQKRFNGNLLPWNYKVQYWSGKYEKASKTLVVEQTGNQVFFDLMKNELSMGIMPYRKIK